MKLNAQLKEDTGYSWVMARMEPASPFGHALVRSPRWFLHAGIQLCLIHFVGSA